VRDEGKHNFRSLLRENRAGLYTTVSLHLLVINLLLLCRLQDLGKIEVPFVLDFSQQEAREMQMQKQERRAQFETELNSILSPIRHGDLRNAAVDETEQILRDDRHTNPSAIYDEARRVQESLDASRQALQQQQGADVVEPHGRASLQAATTATAETYKGPSVLSYNLGGRKATHLPIPVYQCPGGGDVTVNIKVDRRGYVVSADVDTGASTPNSCLIEAARRAAQTSRFARDNKAPERQSGHIVYRFIAQ
jgi:hypothetical protein